MKLTNEEEKLILDFRELSRDCQLLVKAILCSARTQNSEDKIIYLEKFFANNK